MWQKIKHFFDFQCTCCEWKEFYYISSEGDPAWDGCFYVIRERSTDKMIGITYNTRGEALGWLLSSQLLTDKLAEKHLTSCTK